MGISKEKMIPLKMDVTLDSSVKDAISNFISVTGGLDALVNNAGGSARGNSKPIHEQEIEIIDEVIKLNLRGSIICAQLAAKEMVSQKSGKIVNMASVIGMRGKKRMSDYAAAKAGIIGFTKALALESADKGITVNAIAPGYVETQMTSVISEEIRKKIMETIPMKRFAQPSEIADVVLFLVKQSFITGETININGGQYMA